MGDILTKFVFLLKVSQIEANPDENLDLFKNVFDQTSKRGQILIKTVFLPKVSHIQLNFFSVVLKHFRGNSQLSSLFSQKK